MSRGFADWPRRQRGTEGTDGRGKETRKRRSKDAKRQGRTGYGKRRKGGACGEANYQRWKERKAMGNQIESLSGMRSQNNVGNQGGLLGAAGGRAVGAGAFPAERVGYGDGKRRQAERRHHGIARATRLLRAEN